MDVPADAAEGAVSGTLLPWAFGKSSGALAMAQMQESEVPDGEGVPTRNP
jgi:hypothetical protein